MARALLTVGLAEEIEGDPLAGIEPLQAVDQIAAPLIEQQLTLRRGEDLDLQLAMVVSDANGEIAQLWQRQAQQWRTLRAAQLLIDIHCQPLQQLTQFPIILGRCKPGELQIPGGFHLWRDRLTAGFGYFVAQSERIDVSVSVSGERLCELALLCLRGNTLLRGCLSCPLRQFRTRGERGCLYAMLL